MNCGSMVRASEDSTHNAVLGYAAGFIYYLQNSVHTRTIHNCGPRVICTVKMDPEVPSSSLRELGFSGRPQPNFFVAPSIVLKV